MIVTLVTYVGIDNYIMHINDNFMLEKAEKQHFSNNKV